MRLFQSSVVRALCAIVIGGLLSAYPTETAKWVIILIGIIFFVSGAVSCGSYLHYKLHALDTDVTVSDAAGNVVRPAGPMFPIVGIGSLVFGLVLTLLPDTFRDLLVYILAVVLIIGAVQQLVVLDRARRIGSLPWMFWVCPSLVLVAGVVAICRPSWAVALPIYLVGISMMLYGVVEIVNILKIRKLRKALQQQSEQVAKQEEIQEAEEEMILLHK